LSKIEAIISFERGEEEMDKKLKLLDIPAEIA